MSPGGQRPPGISRRRFLWFSGLLPIATVLACSSTSGGEGVSVESLSEPAAPRDGAPPAANVVPEPPFVVPAGEEMRTLLAGTPYESPLYIYGTGHPGNVMMVLGGVHGNEPGGWLAAEKLVKEMRPSSGALLIAPRANKVATNLFVRTTDDLGDLNRLYPGRPDGLPMERMAAEIVSTLREFRVTTLIDMHESWAFYKDRPQNGTAFLGQTIATNPAEPGRSMAQAVTEAVNGRILYPHEEFFFREFPRGRLPEPMSPLPFDTSGNPQAAVSGGSRSSLGLPSHIPNLTVFLVEMGQQQSLDRRVSLHVEVAREMARLIGI